MKTLKQILILLLGLGLFPSCNSVKSINSKLLIGNWKNVKTSSMSSTQDINDPSVISAMAASSAPTIDENVKNSEKESAERLSKVQSIIPDVKSVLEFRQDKTATYTFKDKSVNGTWKIDKPGKVVTFIRNDAPGTMVFEIKKIDARLLQAIERYPQGEVTINYLKK